MTTPTMNEQERDNLDVQIDAARAQVDQLKKRREFARRAHEGQMEPIFRHYVSLQNSLKRRLLSSSNELLSTTSRHYMVAIRTSDHIDDCDSLSAHTEGAVVSRPETLCTEVELCQALHKTEFLVKQLQLVRQNITELSSSMLKVGEELELEGKKNEQHLRQRIRETSAHFQKLADSYGVARPTTKIVLKDDEFSACTEETLEDDGSIVSQTDLVLHPSRCEGLDPSPSLTSYFEGVARYLAISI
uniref:Uncharacterized protein n=1 Tax=Grammatophora oceanica TaxID=210454 RepID=A0A7S1UV71_9STRA|mmetsp:Transcript_25023/g.36649  ORF Transcript_25023/g.36649 Transcript_25023/m.36649 type:complete len:245 (+) Transcript_25023:64-798(+)